MKYYKGLCVFLAVLLLFGTVSFAGEGPQAEEEGNPAFTSEELILKNGEEDIYGVMYLPSNEQEKYPTVILSHGFGSSYSAMQGIAEGLAGNGFAAYVYDFIGGGPDSKSGAADGDMTHMSVLTEASDLSAVMDQIMALDYVDEAQLFLLGESQGGYVSAYVAAQRPEDVCALVLKYPAFALQDDCWKRHKSIDAIPETEKIMGHTIGAIYSQDAMSFDIYDVIGGYKKDVLICHGINDNLVQPSYSERAVEVYENAELHMYEKAGHVFAGDNAVKFINEVTEFLNAHLNADEMDKAA